MSTPTEHLLAKLIVTRYVRNLASHACPMIDWQDTGPAEELTITLSTPHARRRIVLRAEDVLQASGTAAWKRSVRTGLESLLETPPPGSGLH